MNTSKIPSYLKVTGARWRSRLFSSPLSKTSWAQDFAELALLQRFAFHSYMQQMGRSGQIARIDQAIHR